VANDAEDRSWQNASYRQFLRDDSPEDVDGYSDGKWSDTKSIFLRLFVYLAILWLASLACSWITPFMNGLSLGDQILQVLLMQPLDWIFFTSSYLSIGMSVYVFSSTSIVLVRTLWIVFALTLLIASVAHLFLFLTTQRTIFYTLVVVLVLMAIAGGLVS
jgi:hypothetical protein